MAGWEILTISPNMILNTMDTSYENANCIEQVWLNIYRNWKLLFKDTKLLKCTVLLHGLDIIIYLQKQTVAKSGKKLVLSSKNWPKCVRLEHISMDCCETIIN